MIGVRAPSSSSHCFVCYVLRYGAKGCRAVQIAHCQYQQQITFNFIKASYMQQSELTAPLTRTTQISRHIPQPVPRFAHTTTVVPPPTSARRPSQPLCLYTKIPSSTTIGADPYSSTAQQDLTTRARSHGAFGPELGSRVPSSALVAPD